MQPSRHHCLLAFCCVIGLSALAPTARADVLTITSSPSGASLEIDGKPVGPTPYKIEYPGGYFHKTHSIFGERLEHSMILRVSKDGYLPQQSTITTGPFEWVGLTGHHHGSYFLLRSDSFKFQLESVPTHGEFGDTSNGGGPLPAYQGNNNDVGSVARAEGNTSSSHQTSSSEVNSGTLMITSDFIGADIYVDGKFVGQTPSTIHLSAGSHHVEVKSPDNQPWTRDLEVTAGSQISLRAERDTSH
jgi:hypothetical protein